MSQRAQFEEEFRDGPQVPYQMDHGQTQEASGPYQAGYAGPPVSYPRHASALYPPLPTQRSASSRGSLVLALFSLLLIFVMFLGALTVINSSLEGGDGGGSPLAAVIACFCAVTFSVIVLGMNLIFRRR